MQTTDKRINHVTNGTDRVRSRKWFRGTLLMSTALLLLAGITGCGGDTDPEAGFREEKPTGTDSVVRIVQGSNGPSFDGVAFTIDSPADGEVVSGDSIPFRVRLSGVELKAPTQGEGANNLAYSKDGQHIHVIIDNEPYMAHYDTTFMVGGLATGPHTLRAFPSRSWHESIKNSGAFVARTFYVGEKSGDPVMVADQPLLTYSRPKGEYVGNDADKILLDFYVSNATLGSDSYRVIASIDGNVIDTLTEWMPYYIEGLKPGEHTIRLQLIGPDGNPVANGPFNDTERTITVKGAATTAKTDSGEKDEDPDMEQELIDAGRHSSGM